MINWVDKMIQGAAVKRYHTVPTINSETVGEHSFGVAMLVLAITEQRASAELIRAALFHDMAEQFTGDVPFPSKVAFPVVKCALEVAEEDWEREHGFNIELNEADRRCLKWADMLQLLIYCKNQHNLGNKNMDAVFMRGVQFLGTIKPEGRAPEILEWLVNTY